ncbi:MAG: tRNA lysidine(34) synthetase TilS [Anaerolineae bacterium]
MALKQKVLQTAAKYELFSAGETIVVGVSGGPDSLCLLHLLRELREELRIELHVGHLNHQLRGEEAEADATFVAQLAEEWGLSATVEARDVSAYARKHKLAIEEAARRVRYQFLAEIAERVGAKKVAVGHNADDQTETVLMHFLRGAGLAGLRGMRPLSPYPYPGIIRAPGLLSLLRPLLEVPRLEIEAYCRQHKLRPRFDRSNLDTTYFRNRLRHELIPILETYNPNIREVIRRAARVIADDYAYLRQQGDRAWKVVAQQDEQTITFDLEKWLALPLSLQRQLLRRAIRHLRQDLRDIDWIHVENALEVAQQKTTGSRATLPKGLFLFKGYDKLVVGQQMPEPDSPLLDADWLELTIPGTTPLPGSNWQVAANILSRTELPDEALHNQDPWQAYLDYERCGPQIALRRRRSEDRFQPLGLGGRWKPLPQFMTNVKIPAQVRDRWPLLVSAEQILWVVGWHIDERVKITEESEKVLHLRFRKETR